MASHLIESVMNNNCLARPWCPEVSTKQTCHGAILIQRDIYLSDIVTRPFNPWKIVKGHGKFCKLIDGFGSL